uniref:TolC family protein n=1 Tax=Aliarcobacter sp. TaxID=2321116 RepID=UPI004047D6CB
MKKQLIFLIFLTVFTSANEETLIDEKNKLLLIKDDKKEEIKDLKFYLENKNTFSGIKQEEKSSNRYIKAADVDISKYKKVSLMDVVLETVSTSALLKAARESVIQSELRLQDAIAGYYPTLNFEFESARTKATNVGGDKSFKYFNDRNYKLILNQNLYSGGDTLNTIKNLENKLDLEKNKYYIVLSEQVTKSIKAYFDVVFSYKTVLVSESNMKNLNRILDIVTIKYDNGAASIGDLTAIKANVSNAQTQLIKVKSKFTESLRYYEYIVGENYVETLPYEKNFNINVSTFELLYERGIKRNKELVNYYESIESEKYNLKSKESGFAPKVDFELSLDNVIDKEYYEQRRKTLNGLVKLTYNLYNGGRDKNKILNSYSNIRELNFKLDEEKKKLKWNISKLFTSIKSTNESLKSNISEVIALRKMVEAYWEEFKLGEQDLQALLQGQKQLNSAESELIKYENNNITDFFTLLRYTGDLLAFFDIDPEHPKFIDFSKSNYTQEIYIDDKFLNEQEKQEKQEQLRKEEEARAILVKKAQKDENINKFLKEFLLSDDNAYTIDIGIFANLVEANTFIKNNNLDKSSFAYDVVNDLNINSKVNYGIYKNIDDAKKQLEIFSKNNFQKNLEIISIKDAKKLYNDYLAGLKVKIKPVEPEIKIVEKTNTIEKIKQEKKEELFRFNEEFKNDFLKATSDNFTINITSLNKIEEVEKMLISKPELYVNSFVFNYSDTIPLVRWDYGIYKTYEEAEKAVSLLGDVKDRYYPVIQKITNEQNLYNQNINLNLLPISKEPEYEYVNISSKTVYKDPVSLKDIDLSKNKALESKVKDLLPLKNNAEEEKVELIEKVEKLDVKEEIIEEEKKPIDNNIKNLEKQENSLEKLLDIEEEKDLPSVNKVIEEVQDKVEIEEKDAIAIAPIENINEVIKVSEEEIIDIPSYNKSIPVENSNIEVLDDTPIPTMPKTFYIVRLATHYDEPNVINYSKKYNLKYNSESYIDENDSDVTKIVYGMFKTKEEAQTAIEELPKILLKVNRPYIEVVKEKDNLYKFYEDKLLSFGEK